MEDTSHMNGFIVAVIEREDGSKEVVETKNIITTAGDTFYVQQMIKGINGAGSVTNAFANLVLGTGATATSKSSTYANITPITGSNKVPTAGYPKVGDTDTDNTGAGSHTVTWLYNYTKADFNNDAITEGVITVAAPSGTSPVLCHFRFSNPVAKTANDTLKVFVNHTQNGV